jgi:NAD-dependent dihydropyrimidine dehydrogenase PreA subunit
MRYLLNVTTLNLFPDKCTGCGRCVEVCPHSVFIMSNKKAVIIDRDMCMECGACASNCEPEALTVNAGVGCASAIINGMITGNAASCDCSNDNASCC